MPGLGFIVTGMETAAWLVGKRDTCLIILRMGCAIFAT